MQLFGKASKYAIQATRVLLDRPATELTPAAEIARALTGSATYINKILQELVRHQVLGSRKGARGGFYLKRSAQELTLWDLVSPFEDLSTESCAIDGARRCCGDGGCGMHDYWSDIRDEIMRKLKTTTLAEYHRMQGR